MMCLCRLHWTGSENGPMVVSWADNNETSGSMKGWEPLQHLKDSRLPKKELRYWYCNRLWLLHVMFIGPCIIVIVEEWKTNLMSLAILFHFLCAQHVSDINISIIRSLRLCWWITTSVVLFSVRCVLELLVRLLLGGVRFAGWNLWPPTSTEAEN